MKIERIINNNVVSALDQQGIEIVAMGKGIGFQKKAGQELDESRVEKIFRLEGPEVMRHFTELVANMSLVCIQVSDEIISHAKKVLTRQLGQSVYLTLTDHIDFALKRLKKGMAFENALYSEIKHFYPEEFKVGTYALDLIENKIGVRLPEDEAASIAFHLVNAEFGMKLNQTHMMTEMIRHLVDIVESVCPLAGDSIYKDRLITNLKFILNRLLLHKPLAAVRDPVFNEFIKNHCCEEYSLAVRMSEYVNSVSECMMMEDEIIYLTIQLKYTININVNNESS
ncbi:MAG: PRD domain-containing protein [Lachnospiraceae bacterium]|nr:PRD domain-containing protein [Lachnospiraceae bacterium]